MLDVLVMCAQYDSVITTFKTKALHCKAKYVISLKLDPTHLDTEDLILLSNLPKPWALVFVTENRPCQLEYSTHRVTNWMDFCECSFLPEPYCLTLKIFT